MLVGKVPFSLFLSLSLSRSNKDLPFGKLKNASCTLPVALALFKSIAIDISIHRALLPVFNSLLTMTTKSL